ncbi:MAG: nucleotidyltransferase domain-containing protein [Candidatus Methylomirabilia bacterium]
MDDLTEITARLVQEFSPEKVVLFGSRARGTQTPGSDYDLFLVVPETQERPAQRARRAYRCLRELHTPTEIIVRTRSEYERFLPVVASLEARVAREGVVLYGRVIDGREANRLS